jgi:signal peptidase I
MWETWIVATTERILTRRMRRRISLKQRQKKRGPVLDWLDAILSAVVIVLIINQYFLQAYQIPSESMVPTLLVTDRLFVNKYVYGPELVPTALKLPGPWKPQRGDIIIFESPEYLSRGPFLDVAQRIVYMLTLSLVDIDKNTDGTAKVHFLVKRAIGLPGDRIRMNQGDVEILTPGAAQWKPERELVAELGLNYLPVRSYSPSQYPDFKAMGILSALNKAGLPFDSEGAARLTSKYKSIGWDDRYLQMWQSATMWAFNPSDRLSSHEWRILSEGYNVSEDRIFPMGDNRDNSYDARYFGAVRQSKVLGKALVRYWPLNRIGKVR